MPRLVLGDPSRRHRVAIDLPDRVRLVPLGRLRHRPPARIDLSQVLRTASCGSCKVAGSCMGGCPAEELSSGMARKLACTQSH